MLIRDIFSYGISAIKRRKSRKFLSILGVTIGIAAIISIVSLSSGFQDLVNTQFEQGFSSNILIVTTESISFADTESDLKLYIDDTEIIDNIDNINQSTAILQRNCAIRIAEQEYVLNVVGIDYEKYSNIFENTFNTEFGAIPKSPDNTSVIIGARVNDPWKTGSTLTSIGDQINITYTTRSGIDIENRTYAGRISGIMKEIPYTTTPV